MNITQYNRGEYKIIYQIENLIIGYLHFGEDLFLLNYVYLRFLWGIRKKSFRSGTNIKHIGVKVVLASLQSVGMWATYWGSRKEVSSALIHAGPVLLYFQR